MKALSAATSFCYKQLVTLAEPTHPYYHQFQLTMFTGLTYLSTNFLSSIYPERAITFIAVAYAVHRLTQDIIVNFIPTTKGNDLALKGKQILHICSTLALSKIFCHILRESLTFYESIHIIALLLLSLYVPLEAYRRFSKLFNHPDTDTKGIV